MADISDPEINKTIADVKSGKLQWMVLGHVPKSDTKYKVASTGTGGVAEVQEQLNDGKVLFVFLGQDLSGVRKFVHIAWCGEGVTGMKKGLFANHSADMVRLFKGTHVTINARSENDINQDDIMKRLKTATGASFHRTHEAQDTQSVARPSGITYERRDVDQSTTNKPVASTITYEKRDVDQSTSNKPVASSISYEKRDVDQSTTNKPVASSISYEKRDVDQSTANKPKPSNAPPSNFKKPGVGAPAPSPAQLKPTAPAPSKPAPAPAPTKAAPPPPKPAPPPEPEPEPQQEQQQEEQPQETPQEEQPQEEQQYQEQPQEEQQPQQSGGRQVTALYDYEGENEGDLKFKEGDLINVIDDSDPSGWFVGEFNGVQGNFPSNFVQ